MKLTGAWTIEERMTCAICAALIARKHSMEGFHPGFGVPNFESILTVLALKPEAMGGAKELEEWQNLIETATSMDLLEEAKAQIEQCGASLPGAPTRNDWLV